MRVGRTQTKPAFQSVIDLGLRDVGVKNEPRRLAAYFGKWSVPMFALAVVTALVTCGLVSRAGADGWTLAAFGLAWMVAIVVLGFQVVNRSPVVVVKVDAGGTNQATWLVIAPMLLTIPMAVLLGGVLPIAMAVVGVMMVPLAWRSRRHVPEALRKLRAQLAEGESVLGDGIGLAQGARSGREGVRLAVATDRRLLVTTLTGSPDRFVLVDVPYERVSRFGIDWKLRGRVGALSLTVAGVDPGSAETHVFTSITPANLLSIAQALQSHGVHTDDPEVVAEAERGWKEALRRNERPTRLVDRDGVRTRDFDLGLWLLLALTAVAFYGNPFDVGLLAAGDRAIGSLVVAAIVCVICGYVSGTTASLAYLAPLNLLVVPTFFFADAPGVIAVMVVLSAIGAIGLLAGTALRRAITPGVTRPARSAAPGTLRYTLSGLGLIRISRALLSAVVILATIAAAVGFDLSKVALAITEATAKKLPVDGRSNLTGNAASFTYTPGPGLKELVTDQHFGAGPNDGARWELRTKFTEGYNVVSLAHYIFEPHLDDPAAIADFVAKKDREHARIARSDVSHAERVVDGRKGYVWDHRGPHDAWHFAAWFPQPIHSVRVECIARTQEDRFKRLCREAMESLDFH